MHHPFSYAQGDETRGFIAIFRIMTKVQTRWWFVPDEKLKGTLKIFVSFMMITLKYTKPDWVQPHRAPLAYSPINYLIIDTTQTFHLFSINEACYTNQHTKHDAVRYRDGESFMEVPTVRM